MGQRQLGLEEQGPSLWAAPHAPLQGLSPSCLLEVYDPQSLTPQPRGGSSAREGSGQGAWGSWGAQVRIQVCRGQSVPGSNDHRESHAPQSHSSRPKQPLPWDGLWIKEG